MNAVPGNPGVCKTEIGNRELSCKNKVKASTGKSAYISLVIMGLDISQLIYCVFHLLQQIFIPRGFIHYGRS
ncbi:hypothetical protein D3C81_2176810 [compost metagenome]